MRQPSTVETKEKNQQHPQPPITQPITLNEWIKVELEECREKWSAQAVLVHS